MLEQYDKDVLISGVEWTEAKYNTDDNFCVYIAIKDKETISVLDRLTGYSSIRDTETGYRDSNNNFWLASGNFDIREYSELTINEAIQKIKEFANTCIPTIKEIKDEQ